MSRVVRCNYEKVCESNGMTKDPREICARCTRYIPHPDHEKEQDSNPLFMKDYSLTTQHTQVLDAASDRQEEALRAFGIFIGADQIFYHDLGNGEDYIIKKGGKSFTIGVRGNKCDGAFGVFTQKN